jgi:uncharacterized protein (TIGR00645 family)
MVRFVSILILAIRWTLLPIFVGLLAMLLFVTIRFLVEVYGFIIVAFSLATGKLVLAVLSLLDLALIANLIFLFISSARTSLLSQRDSRSVNDAVGTIGHFDLAELKLRIMSTIAAIAAIALLEDFTHIEEVSNRELGWLLAVFMTFLIAGPLLALGERLARKTRDAGVEAPHPRAES